jgi:DNA-binding NarL/FixJ family response regulator
VDKDRIYWVVSDEPLLVKRLREWLDCEAASVRVFDFASLALSEAETASCDGVLFLLDQTHGPAVIAVKKIMALKPLLPIVVVVKKGNIPAAVALAKAEIKNVIENCGDWQGIVNHFIKVVNEKSPNCPLSLSPPEKTILHLLCRGHNNKDIAKILDRHVRTIEVHRSTLFKKLDVSSSLHLTKKALEANLLQKEDLVGHS